MTAVVVSQATGLDDASRELLTAAAPGVDIAELPPEWLERLPQHRLPRAFYARLFIDHVVPKRVDRVVYLDGDVLVRRSPRASGGSALHRGGRS